MRQPSDVQENPWFPACTSGRFIARRNKTVPETGGWEKTMKIDLGQVQARDAEILEAAEEIEILLPLPSFYIYDLFHFFSTFFRL